jgi:polysaccharide export outer membrane protein
MKGFRAFSIRLMFLVLSLTATVVGQTNPSGSSLAPEATHLAQQSDNAPADSDRPKPQQRNPRYKLQPDDGLVISFPLSPEFDQPSHCVQTTNCSVQVQPDGYIDVEGAGSVYVQGLTVPEVVEALKKAYAGVLHDPIIHVDLVEFQRPFFLVSGQVGKPGQYDLRHDTTVSEAIAIAGGFAPTAKTQVFLYRRVSDNMAEVKELKLKDILHGKNVNEDVHLRPGDMIFVPEKAITKFRKYVPYSVGFGAYPSIPTL